MSYGRRSYDNVPRLVIDLPETPHCEGWRDRRLAARRRTIHGGIRIYDADLARRTGYGRRTDDSFLEGYGDRRRYDLTHTPATSRRKGDPQ